MAEPRERPILFSGEMVRALLAGTKTQTRRMVKGPVEFIGGRGEEDDLTQWGWAFDDPRQHGWAVLARGLDERHDHGRISIPCPYGVPGDRLWVRETWGVMDSEGSTASVSYAARLPAGKTLADTDGGCNVITVPEEWRDRLERLVDTERWRPSIHMPRWASRLSLEVASVRVERLQTITQADARAEGVVDTGGAWDHVPGGLSDTSRAGPRGAFEALWNRINGPDSWDTNPWVWVLSFRRVEASR